MPVNRKRAPVSNRERQRQFRERNPHYYRDLHRKRKAEGEAIQALMAQQPELTFEQAYTLVKAPALATKVKTPAEQPTTPLALPAAISEPLVTVQLPLFEQEAERVEARPKLTPADVVEQLKRAA